MTGKNDHSRSTWLTLPVTSPRNQTSAELSAANATAECSGSGSSSKGEQYQPMLACLPECLRKQREDAPALAYTSLSALGFLRATSSAPWANAEKPVSDAGESAGKGGRARSGVGRAAGSHEGQRVDIGASAK